MEAIRPLRFPMGGDDEWVAVGRRGWTLWHHPEASSVAFARFEPTPGRPVIAEVRFVGLDGRRPVRANDLRLLALGRLDSLASDPDVRLMLDSPASAALPELDPNSVSVEDALNAVAKHPIRPETSNLRIDVPPKGQRNAFFYAGLELAYRRAAAQSRRPAQDLAQANDVPVTTVHAWLKALKKFKEKAAAETAERRRQDERFWKRIQPGLDALGLTWDEYYELHQADDPLDAWGPNGSFNYVAEESS